MAYARTHGQEHEESCADMMKHWRAPVLGTSSAGLQDIHPAEMTAAITEGVGVSVMDGV